MFAYDGFPQSPLFSTFMNPVIPGDHSDCTLTKIGGHFYTTGSSFNPTPVIYHSTDLVHWEAIAQPVAASWTTYGDQVAGGAWGGQMVYHNNKYWDFFSRANAMYFVSADDPKGPWSLPTQMSTPAGVPGLGYDNSIFIDDDSTWYLLVKNGQVNNWIVQLGNNGQPSGAVYNLCWINPAPSYPFSWAEGPVMWKYRGMYYYSFAKNVAGGQKVFRSPVLTGDQTSWTNLGDFFDETDPLKSRSLFQNPNHSSAAVTLDDSTSWVLHPLWRNAGSNEWYGQGRQGLLNQVRYDQSGKPTADYPVNVLKTAPNLPSSGIPWMVPHSDFFTSDKLNPEWSFLGYTPASSYSLTARSGWLSLSDKRKINTVCKTDAEHNYSLMTRVDFDARATADQAGLWVFNGLQTLSVKLCSSADSSGNRTVVFSYNGSASTTVNTAGTILWLKLVRENHIMTGYWSADGSAWIQVGGKINVAGLDGQQTDYNGWCGNRQGLFVQNSTAYFDLYIYRDAYTPILAECPANQSGTTRLATGGSTAVLDDIHANDWALYAGVEFGNAGYAGYEKIPDSLKIVAFPFTDDGAAEIWLDSLDTGTKIGECRVKTTATPQTYETYAAAVQPVSGRHDVYVKFTGTGAGKLFLLQSITFTAKTGTAASITAPSDAAAPYSYRLEQNYPNPFNPSTTIAFTLKSTSFVSLKIFDAMGRDIATLVSDVMPAGAYTREWNASAFASGTYFYRLRAGSYVETKCLTLVK